MNFINPLTEFGFKKIFAAPQSKDVLISFLDAMLYNAEPTIQDLEIIDPYKAPSITGLKDTWCSEPLAIVLKGDRAGRLNLVLCIIAHKNRAIEERTNITCLVPPKSPLKSRGI